MCRDDGCAQPIKRPHALAHPFVFAPLAPSVGSRTGYIADEWSVLQVLSKAEMHILPRKVTKRKRTHDNQKPLVRASTSTSDEAIAVATSARNAKRGGEPRSARCCKQQQRQLSSSLCFLTQPGATDANASRRLPRRQPRSRPVSRACSGRGSPRPSSPTCELVAHPLPEVADASYSWLGPIQGSAADLGRS
jgi:hypothetical protein